jgi:hypothetical protein
MQEEVDSSLSSILPILEMWQVVEWGVYGIWTHVDKRGIKPCLKPRFLHGFHGFCFEVRIILEAIQNIPLIV